MSNNYLIKALLLGSLFSVFTSCAEKDADKIGDAQQCINKATKTTALGCLSGISGLDSEASNAVKCAAMFISEGLSDPARMYQIVQNASQAGNNGVNSAFGVLAFQGDDALTNATDVTKSTLSSAYCRKSKSPGLMWLSSLTSIATTVATVATPPYDASSIQSGMLAIAAGGDPVAQAAIGTAAVTAYTSNCADGGAQQDSQFCSDFAAQITACGGSANAACIGLNLATQYGN